MSNKKREFFLVLIIVIAVAAVSYIAVIRNESNISKNQNTANTPLSTYTNQKYGIQIDYPYLMTATSTFSTSYLLPNNWNVNGPQTPGDQIVSIQYPGSDNILSAQVRIGASTVSASVASCLKFNSNFATSTKNINGVDFIYSIGSDAAMSHFSSVKSYRAIHNSTCFAIDEVVYGTNPQVYSPPAHVPFDQVVSQSTLDGVVDSFTFIK